MKKYDIPRLTDKTPEADRTKLVNAFKAVQGVQNATLRVASHQVEITGRDQKDPKRDDIAAAATKVGFPLANK